MPVHDLLVHPRENELVVGTHGRSVYILDVKPIEALLDLAGQAGVIDQPLHILPVKDVAAPASWTRQFQQQLRGSFFEMPEQTSPFFYYTKAAGKATLTIKDTDGNPLKVVEADAIAGINVFEWNGVLDADLAKKAEAARQAKTPAERPAGVRGPRGGAAAAQSRFPSRTG